MVALGLDCRHQPEVIENGRMETIGKTMHILTQAHQFLAHLPPRAAVGSGRQTSLGLRGVNRQPRQALRHVIVQFAGQTASLPFVGGEQLLAQTNSLTAVML
jgi:hypothetical protein